MHEREPDEDEEGQRPIFVAGISKRKDGDLRAAWMDTAQYIADTERRIASWMHQLSALTGESTGHDEDEPGFLAVGKRASLGFIGAMAAGIIEHGQAFAAWARQAGSDPDTLSRFKDAYLGSWESADQFAAQMLEYLRPTDQMEYSAAQEVRPDLQSDAQELAQELQRRGDISVVANPEGGVWVFRRLQGEALPTSPQQSNGSAEGR